MPFSIRVHVDCIMGLMPCLVTKDTYYLEFAMQNKHERSTGFTLNTESTATVINEDIKGLSLRNENEKETRTMFVNLIQVRHYRESI
jgi:hypothetical protein